MNRINLLILIARVSDPEQKKALPAQELRLRNYAESYGIPSEYHQFDETAHEDTRKKFSQLVEHIKSQKERCAVVFDKIDRFTRDSSQEEVKALTNLVKQDKIELHFPNDALYINKDSSAADWFRLGIGMALAKYYSDSIRDNVKRRFEQMLNDKTWVGYAPMGYKNVNKGTSEHPVKDIIIDKQRAPHVISMFEMRATGMPYSQIAKVINEKGMRTRKGKVLTKSSVEKIIGNSFYYGQMEYMGKKYPHKYEPLIDRELFNACQSVRNQRHSQHPAYDSIDFTIKDFVRCKECGCTVSSYYSKGKVYMKCSRSKKGVNCSNKQSSEAAILPDVTRAVASVVLPEAVLELVIKELKKRHDNQQEYFATNIESTRQEYDQITARLKAITYERLDSATYGKGISSELYAEIVDELTTRQQELDKQLVKLTHSNKSFMVTASYLLDLAQRAPLLFENASPRLRQKLLKFLLSNVELFDKQLSYIVNDPFKTFIEANKKAPNGPDDAIWCG